MLAVPPLRKSEDTRPRPKPEPVAPGVLNLFNMRRFCDGGCGAVLFACGGFMRLCPACREGKRHKKRDRKAWWRAQRKAGAVLASPVKPKAQGGVASSTLYQDRIKKAAAKLERTMRGTPEPPQ